MFHLIEITVWALFFLWKQAMPDLSSALYFSAVTYTTTGYGDLVLPAEWRLVGAVEALTGILMCGWSTGFFFAVVERDAAPYRSRWRRPETHIPVTIAKRLILLLAVPLLALTGLGVFTRWQLTTIETRSRFVAELQVPSLATLGNISRILADLRVQLRNHVLAASEAERASVRSTFERDDAELDRLLDQVRAQPDLRRQGPPPAEGLSRSVPGLAGPGEADHVAGRRGTP